MMNIMMFRPDPSASGPLVTAPWTHATLTLIPTIAALPILIVTLKNYGVGWSKILFVSLAVTIAWQALFAVVRKRPPPLDGTLTAILVAVALPPAIPEWQVIISMTFGIVIGQEVFGGRGRNFLSPAVVTLAFLIFAFPSVKLNTLGYDIAVAALLGALILLATGLMSWRIIVGAAAAFCLAPTITVSPPPLTALTSGAFVFAAAFLAADPVSAAATRLGRWVYGALFGALAATFCTTTATVPLEATVFAALLASLFAPLIDTCVIWINLYQRRRLRDRS